MIEVSQNRPLSGKDRPDSFMSDKDAGDNPIIEEHQIQMATDVQNKVDDTFESSSFDSENDVSEETYGVEPSSDSESLEMSSEDDDNTNQPIRVYDARFKIPAQSNIGQLMSAKNSSELNKGQSNKEYRNMVKNLERYKKFVSTTVICIMALAMLFNIGVYVLTIKNLQEEKYFLARTRYNITKEVDFEEINVAEIMYFLYKNKSADAHDAGDDLNLFIASNIEELCDNKGVYLLSDSTRMKSIRNNINSFYMLFSESYILLLMLLCMIFAVIVIPQRMKEHHVPMLMR